MRSGDAGVTERDRGVIRSDCLLTITECIRQGPFCEFPNVCKRSLFASRLRQLNARKFPAIGHVGPCSELYRPDTKTPGVAEIHLAFRFSQRIPVWPYLYRCGAWKEAGSWQRL